MLPRFSVGQLHAVVNAGDESAKEGKDKRMSNGQIKGTSTVLFHSKSASLRQVNGRIFLEYNPRKASRDLCYPLSMTYLLLILLSATAFGYECTIQTDFYRSLPVFLGTTGTMEISTENILVLTNRGTGVQTETKANITRYFYPAERIEAHVYRTIEGNGDVTVTTTPKFFNCNLRQAVLRDKRIVSLSYCSVDGCRHLDTNVCEYLINNFTEDKVRTARNALATIFETESRVKQMVKKYHSEETNLLRDYHKLETSSPRVLGVSMSDFETEEGTTATFGLLKLGSYLANETEYCRKLTREGKFWLPDLRPSKYLPKREATQ